MLLLFSLLSLHGIYAESLLSQGITDFALQLSSNLEFLSDSVGKNFVWSPYSAHSAFSQVLLGAEDRTELEMADVLGIKKEDTALYEQLRKSVKSGNSTLKIANLLALAKNFKPKTEYTQNLQKRFGSQLLELDFAGKPAESVAQINNFVADKTNNKIEDLLDEDNVDGLTRMVLVNAVYFKALWKTAFNAENTIDSEFNTTRGVVTTPFMTLNLKARILEEEDYRVLELPYQDENKALLIVLPNRDDLGVMDLLRNINFTDIKSERLVQTNVLMPKFKIKERTKLKSLMQAAGMRQVFMNAQLGGISEDPLFVDDAFQEAFIEVSEEGTEAAAATGIILGLRIGIRRTQFTVDRPFGFVVYDFDQEVPLFVGKVNDPSSGISTRSSVQTQSGKTGAPITDSTTESVSKPDKDECGRQRENIPNALNNVELCKQAEEGKLFDWLRSYRAVCEESNRVRDNFQAAKCVNDWCTYAKQNLVAWQTEQSGCARGKRQLNVCRTNENKLKAFNNLKCATVG